MRRGNKKKLSGAVFRVSVERQKLMQRKTILWRKLLTGRSVTIAKMMCGIRKKGMAPCKQGNGKEDRWLRCGKQARCCSARHSPVAPQTIGQFDRSKCDLSFIYDERFPSAEMADAQ